MQSTTDTFNFIFLHNLLHLDGRKDLSPFRFTAILTEYALKVAAGFWRLPDASYPGKTLFFGQLEIIIL